VEPFLINNIGIKPLRAIVAAPIIASPVLHKSAVKAKFLFTGFSTTYKENVNNITSKYINTSLAIPTRKRNSFVRILLTVASPFPGTTIFDSTKLTEKIPSNIVTM
jgi:hypothetical protein